MHPSRRHPARAGTLAAAFAAALAAQDSKPAPTPVKVDPIAAPLRAELPELVEQQSSWAFDGDAQTAARDRGAYPIGNGKVFGCLGLGPRASTIRCVSGPSYQTADTHAPEGNFGTVTVELHGASGPLPLERQRLRRVRGAAIVVTEDASASGDVKLRTLAFATPGRDHLTSVIEVEAPAGQALTVRVTCTGARADGASLRTAYGQDASAAGAVLSLTNARAEGSSLVADVAQGRFAGALVIGMHAGAMPPPNFLPSAATVEAGLSDARATLLAWKEIGANAFHVDTDHRKLADLIEDTRATLLSQRCARSGMVVPMLSHRVARPREQNGPLVAFLRLNMWDDARRILQYWHQATRLQGRIPTEVRLDLDFAPLANTKTDWSTITVPPGDAALWILLQHFWYWRVTQDLDLIQAHWPLIEVCLKRLPRGKDDLIPFGGDESHLDGALGRLFPGTLGEEALLIAHGEDHESYSLTNGVLFLLAIQAVGEMVDGIDKRTHPERYPNGEMPAERVSRPYTERSFGQMEKVEKRFWQTGRELFAPALSPLNEAQHQPPFANVNLSLLWAGWTFPTGERSRDNLRNSLKELWLRGTRVGSTPTCGYATGDAQAMLVVALCERDAVERLDAFDELLKLAEPAGEWGELYDPDGRPVAARDPQHPCRAHPGMTGVSLDAVIFALNGMRYVSVPNWDNTDIRAELRMPHGASYLTMKELKKDGRRLHVFMNEIWERLSEEELKENEKKKEEDRRRTDVAHRRLAFKMELASENPKRGYYDVGLNSMGTMFVRYLWKDKPVIDEKEFWTADKEVFLPQGPDPKARAYTPPVAQANADLLWLGSRRTSAEFAAGDKTTLVDTGMPFTIPQLVTLLRKDDGSLLHASLYLDRGFDAVSAATRKTSRFWQDAAWTKALADYQAAGGKVLRTQFFTKGDAGGTAVEAKDGAFTVPGGTTLTIPFRSEQARETVLRLGSGAPLTVGLNGAELFQRKDARRPAPDVDSQLATLREGANTLTILVGGTGPQVVFARASDARGLPVAGVTQ